MRSPRHRKLEDRVGQVVNAFVFEFICSGLLPDSIAETSLQREGRAMLTAIANDLSDNGHTVSTLWHSSMGTWPAAGIDAIVVNSNEHALQQFHRLAQRCDITILIAPEFDGILYDLANRVAELGGQLANSTPEAIALTSDKLRFATHLQTHDMPTLNTIAWSPEKTILPFEFPAIVKPIDGAGSSDVFRLNGKSDLQQLVTCVREQDRHWIAQPFVSGTPASVGVICGEETNVLPLTQQRLSDDGRFYYSGGYAPAFPNRQQDVATLVRRLCKSIDGLRGYVGIDLILPDDPDSPPVIIELNPRLTTSYVGYRAMFGSGLADPILGRQTAKSSPGRHWISDVCVSWDSAGNVKTV